MRSLLLILVACGGGKGGAIDGQQSGGAVGRVCDPGTAPAPNEIILASPSLDCDARLCLAFGSAPPAMCSATCFDATDCQEAPESACTAGFTCAPVVSVGPFACQNVCVCADRVPVVTCDL
jgi:hypothetical protein